MSKALNMDLIYCFFDAANMHRWNDHLRPIELTELDKQAHKMAIAWMLAKFEETNGANINWTELIENSMFSFIQRLILTDLKPQLFHKIKQERPKELNEFVISEFETAVPNCNADFKKRFVKYLEGKRTSKEDQVIRAAHYLATNWEFRLIKDMNRSMFGIAQTERDIELELMAHSGLMGLREMVNKSAYGFVDLFGQLRFQQRWARTPRIPKTTVLGHSILVANMVHLNNLDKKAGKEQIYMDYFKALFHDLPEVLTKDVISPVKNRISGLNKLLEDYEEEMMESKVIPLIPSQWKDEFRTLIYDPFGAKDNTDSGYDIKTCDLLGAYIEADLSIRYGVGSDKLKSSRDELREKLIERKGIDSKGLIERLDAMTV